MKRYLFILLSIIFTVPSCDFESGSTLGSDITVIDDQTDVKIAIDELGDEFQYVISEDFSPNDTAWFNVSSNINVAIASKIKDRNLAQYAYYAIYEPYSPGSMATMKSGDFQIYLGIFNKPKYTIDNFFGFSSINPSLPEWIEYVNYGPVSSYCIVRIKGTEGTLYLNPSDEGLSQWENDQRSGKGDRTYYIAGTVTGISKVTERKDRSNEYVNFLNSIYHFSNHSMNPYFESEEVTLTVETSNGTFLVPVYGEKRNGDMTKMLNRVKVGDKVEIPVYNKDKKGLQQGVLKDVMTLDVFSI